MKRPALAVFAAAAALTLAAGAGMRRSAPPDFPRLAELQTGPFAFQDLVIAATGFRASAADLAWVQLLQYGAGLEPAGYEDDKSKPYTYMKEMCLRVTRLDPSFHRAYLYGAGFLGWFRGVERPDEAAALLAEGQRRSPEDPQFSLYLAALAYKKAGDVDKMIAVLETAFDRPDTPTLMKTVLANIRQSRGENAAALDLWLRILANERDAGEHARARLKIQELRVLPPGPKRR